MADKATQIDFLISGLRDTSGAILGSGTINTYAVGTTTNKATYLDRDKTSTAPNPIVLDSSGSIMGASGPIYGDGLYDFLVKDSSGTTIDTFTVSVGSSAGSIASDSVSLTNVTGKFLSDVFDGGYDVTLKPSDIQIKSGPIRDVRAYTDFNAAVSTIGATECTLLVSDAQVLTSSVTIPSTLILKFSRAGKITLGAFNLIINGVLEAGPYQIFDTTGGGAVTFGDGAIMHGYPEWWGAVGDGATDDTFAIQACINACMHTKLGIGSYSTTGVRLSPMNKTLTGVSGARQGKNVGDGITQVPNTRLVAAGTQAYVLRVIGHGHDINNICVDGNFTATDCLIQDDAPYSITYYRCTFVNAIPGLASGGKLVNLTEPTNDNNDNIRFLSCEFKGNNSGVNCQYGLYISGTNALFVKIEDCIFYNCDTQVFLVGGGVDIKNSQFETWTTTGIHLDRTSNILIDSCYSESPGVFIRSTENSIPGASRPMIIKSTQFNDPGVNFQLFQDRPIVLLNNSFAGASPVLFIPLDGAGFDYNIPTVSIGNYFASTISYTGTGATNIVSYGDIYYDRPAANVSGVAWAYTEVVLPNADATPSVRVGRIFTTTGTTPITNFLSGTDGQMITIIADSTITITNGTPIRLSGAANYDMVATETLTLFLRGSVWVEIARGNNVV